MKGTLWKILSQLAPSVLDDLEESSVDAELLVAKFDEALADEALAKFAEQEAPPYKLREILELRRAAKMLRGGDVKGALDLIEQIIGAAGEPEPEAESDPETEPTQESKPEPEPKKEASMSAPKTEAPVHTDGLTEAERARLAELEHEASELRVDRMVESTALPPAIKNKLRESFRGKVVDRDAIQGAIKAELDAFEALKRDGVIHDPGAHAKGVSLIESGYTKLDKFQIGMHKLVSGSEVLTDKEKAAGVPAFRGIREAYETITGDTEHRGRIDRKRISQDYFAVLKEAVDTAGFPQILANTLNRKMVRDYNMLNFQWRDFVNTSSARDFRNQELVRFGGYLNLATVAESAAYPALASPTDENVQYSVVKRGGTETVTFEVIKNDDVRFVQKIPTRMARAAARTLEQRAMDLILSYTAAINDTNVYDGTVLYDAAHNNITATALTWGNVWAAIEAMGQQTEADSAEPLGVRPKYLLVPPQLEQEAREIVESTDRPDTGDRATNTLRGMVEVRVNHFLRGDATNWYLIADPAQNETIEISFLDGKQEPEMLVQDTPTVDNVFTNDIITYRVRHIYEGAVVDYRSFYGAIVP